MRAPATPAAPALIDREGSVHRFGAFVTAIAPTRDGRVLGFALGDGTVRLVDPATPQVATSVTAHAGACLVLVADLEAGSLLSGGDDGRLVAIAAGREPAGLGRWQGRWIEAIDAHPKPGLRAVAAGRQVHLLDRGGGLVQTLEHPSTATGVAFDPSGQRLAVAHYGGVTLWIGYRDGWRPTLLPWKGSHLAVTWSPSGKFIVSSMQENVLHGWRLADRRDMRMAGYPAKVRSLSWAVKGRWLATSGADCAVLWPFKGEDGPMGRQPLTLGMGGELATVVAGHPTQPLVAIGYKDGLVLLARVEEQDFVTLKNAGPEPISAMAWTPDGKVLAIGAETGWAAVLPLAR